MKKPASSKKELTPGQQKAKEKLGRMKKGGKKGENPNILTMKVGDNEVRFFPVAGSELEFCQEANVHYYAGERYLCLTTEWFGNNNDIPGVDTTCPFCRRFLRAKHRANKKFPRGSKAGKKAYFAAKDEWGARLSYFSYAADASGEDIVPKIFPFGPMILQQLLSEFVNGGRKFFSPKIGRVVTIEKEQLSDSKTDIKYTVTVSDRKDDLSEVWPQIKEALPDMNETKGGIPKAVDPEKIEEVIRNNEIEYADEDDEEEKKPSSKKRRARDEEDDEEGEEKEEDDDEEEVDEEEEEPPRRKKKKTSPEIEKAKKKLRRKAGEDDDEDEEDSDDDEDEEEEDEEDDDE